MRRRLVFVLATGCATVALTACGGGGSSGSGGEAACTPSGTVVRISANDATFDPSCVAAPANTAFTVRFDNEDSDTHNVDIQRSGVSVFTGDFVKGPKVVTYDVGALPPGSYTYRCDIHPVQMHGTFVVAVP